MNRSQPSVSASRRGTAQERLLHGVTQACDCHGFARLTVERIVAAAEVSRATFYQYFSNVEDCFRSAYRHHAEQLVEQVRAEVGTDSDPAVAVLNAIGMFAVSHQAEARLLMREGLAAGQGGLIERGDLIAGLARTMTGAGASPTVDLAPGLLIGGAFRFLTMRLSDGESLQPLAGELREWAGAFPADFPGPRWTQRLTPALPEHYAVAPPRGSRVPGPVRERIIRGVAMAIRAKGYRATTVTDIVAAAGVSRRRFYDEFPSKAHAFIAAYEFMFHRVLAESAPAFFAHRDWRERVWDAALAFTGVIAREPLLAYLGLVECYAVGPDYLRRVHDTQLAFTLFLEDGYRQGREAESRPRAFSQLVAATIFELAFEASRRAPRFDVRRVQPLAVYLALAPFLGPEEAGEFVVAKLRGERLACPGAA
jgi:AcrR family transcriptional regulator